MSAGVALANGAVAAAGLRAHARFRRALADPAGAQEGLLGRLLARNAQTAFGTGHDFAKIRSLADYQQRVPLRTFDQLRPWLDRVEGGEQRVLTDDPVRWLEPSGGSSGPSKLVPCTGGLLGEFGAATLPWLVDLYCSRPRLRTGTAYWAISPPGRRAALSRGGVPIGMDGDTAYFPRPLRPLLARAQAVPPAVGAVGDVEACRHATLRALLSAQDLAFVSVWSPSFLTLLADALDRHWDRLRAEVARPLPRTPPEDLGLLWPRLDLISCWADGHAGRALAGMRRRFPHVDVQPKGLLATEGVVSIPLHDAEAPVPAVTSHVLEFLEDGDGGRPRGVHQLDTGGTYEVVLSTGGGLYRYRLGDLVRVEGRLAATPLLRFIGRADGRCDLVGEKLTPALVEAALAAAEAAVGVPTRFALLTPHPDRKGYVLSVEPLDAAVSRAASDWADRQAEAERLAAALDAELCAAHHYRLARDLGQLRPVAGRALRDAERTWEAARVARGQRAGAVKPPVLDGQPFDPRPCHPGPVREELACAPPS